MEIDQTLVDAHFEFVPGVGTFSRRSLTGSNLQMLGRKTDRSANVKFLVERSFLQIGADLLQVLDVARGQGDSNAVDNLISWGGSSLFFWWEGHDFKRLVVKGKYFRLTGDEKKSQIASSLDNGSILDTIKTHLGQSEKFVILKASLLLII